MQQTLFGPSYSNYIVLSASRMTDMPAFYPKELIKAINLRIEKGYRIHTLILWTKHISSLFTEPLYSFLINLKKHHTQIWIQITITGMGGIEFGKATDGSSFFPEPNVPSANESLKKIPELIKLVETPNRILLRIDPIACFKLPNGETKSNLAFIEPIVQTVANTGIKKIAFSLLEKGTYKKVDNALLNLGIETIYPNFEEKESFKHWLGKIEKKYKISFQACCVKDFKESRCIDAELLEQYHNKKIPVSKKVPRSRELCGCTKSIDIGGWPPKPCLSGCIYCYAKPIKPNIKNH